MKKHVSHYTTDAFLTVFFGGAYLFLGGTTMAGELKAGDKAPQFELPSSDGNTYKLVNLNKQEQVVVIAWYPKAFSGG